MPRMETPTANFTHHFLIAMPNMVDPHFTRTLTYIAEHNEQGALGIIVNRPIDMTLASLFERIEVPLEAEGFAAQPVYFGGPVQTDRGFVLHRPVGSFQSSIDIGNGLALTSSRDVLQSLGGENEPEEVLVTLGYAGWGPGQLEEEISRNAWLTVPASAELIFDTPVEQRYDKALALLGLEAWKLSPEAGHA